MHGSISDGADDTETQPLGCSDAADGNDSLNDDGAAVRPSGLSGLGLTMLSAVAGIVDAPIQVPSSTLFFDKTAW